MDIKEEYYRSKYEELKELSNTEKCRTVLVRNKDTGELAVKKVMGMRAYDIYARLKGLEHQNIVKVWECFLAGDTCITVEEYINGTRLDAFVGERGIGAFQSILLGMQICDALAEIHKRGIIHRDIQPKNIIVTKDGVAKLLDFDIARLEKAEVSRDTEILGTAGYASPEQYGFQQTGRQSDIYSLGVLLRFMATGKTDGKLTDNGQWMSDHGKVQIAELDHVLAKSTEMDSRNRYANVEELREALRGCLVESTTEKRKESYFFQGKNPFRKREASETEQSLEEKELPPLTFDYVLHTIPGFRTRNILYEIISSCIYALFLWIHAAAALSITTGVFWNIYGVILYVAWIVIPYTFLVNIADIVERFPKRSFRTKKGKIFYQIGMALILYFMIALLMGCTLPLGTS